MSIARTENASSPRFENVTTEKTAGYCGIDPNYEQVNVTSSEKTKTTCKEAAFAIPQAPTPSQLASMGERTGSRGFLQTSPHDKINV